MKLSLLKTAFPVVLFSMMATTAAYAGGGCIHGGYGEIASVVESDPLLASAEVDKNDPDWLLLQRQQKLAEQEPSAPLPLHN